MKNSYFGFSQPIRGAAIRVVLIFLLNGCAFVSHKKDNSETMYIKASALTKLSAAVEATVRYDNVPNTLSDQELLMLSTQDDPALLEPFNGYVLKVNREFNHAIVLMCNEEGTKGLLEDAGCTAPMDNHLWQKNALCTFTIHLDVVCPY